MWSRTQAPAEIYARPATPFAAGFIGTPPMNVIPASVLTGAGHGDMLAGIRPEALRVAARGIPARVLHGEYLGADTVLTCDAGGGVRLLARLPGLVSLAPGAAIHLAAEPADIHFFDAGTGRRVSSEVP